MSIWAAHWRREVWQHIDSQGMRHLAKRKAAAPSDAEAVKISPGNGWRVARLMMAAASLEDAEALFHGFINLHDKSDAAYVAAALTLRRSRIQEDEFDAGWKKASVPADRLGRPLCALNAFQDAVNALEDEFPE